MESRSGPKEGRTCHVMLMELNGKHSYFLSQCATSVFTYVLRSLTLLRTEQ